MATYVAPQRTRAQMTPSSMICFRAGDLLPALAPRAAPSETGSVCRRDLRRYYWLLAVALEGAPPIPADVWPDLAARASAALSTPTATDDLAAALFVCLGALPGWDPLALYAVADRLETAQRRGLPLDDPAQIGIKLSDPHQAQPSTTRRDRR